jgi:queuosine precursor transporter
LRGPIKYGILEKIATNHDKESFYMTNEFIFLLHAGTIMTAVLAAVWYGKEALIAFVCICSILANFFVIKQITLCGFEVVSTDVFALAGLIGITLIQEFFGEGLARKAIVLNFALLIFYFAMTQFHLWYLPNQFDVTQLHFAALLAPTFRIISASLVSYLITQLCLVGITRCTTYLTKGSHFTTRTIISIALAQLVDTILFSFLALYGMVHTIGHIIVISYSIKLIALVCATPFVMLARRMGTSSGNQS